MMLPESPGMSDHLLFATIRSFCPEFSISGHQKANLQPSSCSRTWSSVRNWGCGIIEINDIRKQSVCFFLFVRQLCLNLMLCLYNYTETVWCDGYSAVRFGHIKFYIEYSAWRLHMQRPLCLTVAGWPLPANIALANNGNVSDYGAEMKIIRHLLFIWKPAFWITAGAAQNITTLWGYGENREVNNEIQWYLTCVRAGKSYECFFESRPTVILSQIYQLYISTL